MAEKDEFKAHGIYTISNCISWEVEISEDGEAARIRKTFDTRPAEVSEWSEIKFSFDEDTKEDFGYFITGKGSEIDLREVMRIG